MNDSLFSADLLSSSDAERIAFLRRELSRHNDLYYLRAAPEISDVEFDRLMAELVALEKKHPELASPDSPTARVGGAPLPEFAPFEHIIPMQSLENTYSLGEVADFDSSLRKILGAETLAYAVEPKTDGLAFAAHYEDGLLAAVATRGDGVFGDNITANARTIRNLPLRIDGAAHHLEVRGEIYMSKSGFVKLAREQEERGETPFKNPRNAAAGSIKLLDPAEVAKRPLRVVIYAVGRTEGVELPETHHGLVEFLRSFGLPVQPRSWQCPDIATVVKAIAEMEGLRHSFDFETDGAVIKLDDRTAYKTLGSTAKAPRWARAYKYAPEQVETVVEAITVQVGRTGVLTPVAELRTVRLSGSDISRATLHNEDEIRRKDVRVGDHVMIEKAGEVIPAVVSVLKEKRTGAEAEFEMPLVCPECGSPVFRAEGEVAVRCTNALCPAQLCARVEHFASAGALDIKGLGAKVAQALVEQKLISHPMDLYALPEQLLATLDLDADGAGAGVSASSNVKSSLFDTEPEINRRLGESNARTILAALAESKNAPLAKWIFAMGIPNIGATAARELAALHKDFEDFAASRVVSDCKRLYDLMSEADETNPNSHKVKALGIAERVENAERNAVIVDEIEALGSRLRAEGLASVPKGAGAAKYTCVVKPETAKSLTEFFTSDFGKDFVGRIRANGVNPVGQKITRDAGRGTANGGLPFVSRPASILAGKSTVITGTFTQSGLSREQASDKIRELGGAVMDSVSSKTDFLIVGENPGASKTNKAAKFGTKVLTEAEFLEIIL